MGDGQYEDLRFDFDRRLKLKFLGGQIITDVQKLLVGGIADSIQL